MKSEQELAFGLWQLQDGDKLTCEIRDLRAFRDALGDRLVVGFAQLFTVANRMNALHTLMAQTNADLPPVLEGVPQSAQQQDSAAAGRNRVLIGTFIFGVLHELQKAVTTLQDAGLTDVLRVKKDQVAMAAWKRLRKAGLRWRGEAQTEARNQLAFHVGDAPVMQKGLERWPADTPLIISVADGPSVAGTMFSMGGDLLLRGLETTDVEFAQLVDQAIKDGMVPADAMMLFIGVLHAKGAPIPSPSELEDMTPGNERENRNLVS